MALKVCAPWRLRRCSKFSLRPTVQLCITLAHDEYYAEFAAVAVASWCTEADALEQPLPLEPTKAALFCKAVDGIGSEGQLLPTFY